MTVINLDFYLIALRVAELREIAKSKGLNPNLWFDNVELIAAKEIGQETVQYVSNIYKFYASYRALDSYAEQRGKKLRVLSHLSESNIRI